MPFEKRMCLLGVAVLVSSVLGCVTPGVDTFDYSPPEKPQALVNEVIVEKEFSQVWDLLIRELSKSFFAINNVEKASRIINLSFTTTELAKFVGCGSTRRTHAFLGSTDVYEYQVVETNQYKYAGPLVNASAAWEVEVFRKPSLEGRINVYVAPVASGTEVTVNARYIVELGWERIGRLVNAQRAVLREEPWPAPSSSEKISFNTNTVGELKWDGDEENRSTICYATGALEDSILDFVR